MGLEFKDYIGFAITILLGIFGAWYGGERSRKASMEAAEWQFKETLNEKRIAHLHHLHSEFTHNVEVLKKIQSFLKTGPILEHSWSPAKVNAMYLLDDAWKALIQEGVLQTLEKADRITFEKAARSVIHARRCIEEIEANWTRIREWAVYDQETKNPQPLMQPKLYFPNALAESTKRVNTALDELGISLKILASQLGLKEME